MLWARLPIIFAKTFSRPRWAMAITMLRTPCSPAFSRARSKRGIKLSEPSRENVLEPVYFLRTNSSKSVASVNLV